MRDTRSKKRWVAAFLYFTILALAFNGCKKDQTSTADTYFMKFDVDGTPVEYTDQASLYAEFAQVGPQHTGAVFGSDATSRVNLSISDSTEITTGTYSGYTNKNGIITAAVIGYFDENGTNYGQSSSIDPNLKITISEMTAASVRGTFNGTLMASGKANISITNGEFFVKRAN